MSAQRAGAWGRVNTVLALQGGAVSELRNSMPRVSKATAVRSHHLSHAAHGCGIVEVGGAVVKLLANVFWFCKAHDGVDDLFSVRFGDVITTTLEDPLDLFWGADCFHFRLDGGFRELVTQAVDEHVHAVATCFAFDTFVVPEAPRSVFEGPVSVVLGNIVASKPPFHSTGGHGEQS